MCRQAPPPGTPTMKRWLFVMGVAALASACVAVLCKGA
jgi:hypothetical protein